MVSADQASGEAARLLGQDGPFAEALDGFAPREAQIRMAEAVQATLETGETLVAEAGTGIVMTFSAPCWVDVRDNAREFKLFGEMPNGATKVLGGQPPYKMVIGNSRAVTITINGEPFDLTPYAKGNVARFTLDP